MDLNCTEFEKIIGYNFKKKAILKEALTHSSYSNNVKSNVVNNERLEFLGDSVLSLIVSNFLFRKYPKISEGVLTKHRSLLVCSKSLSGFARQIQLGKYLEMGKGEDVTGGRDRDSILENTFEAVIGAIYIDGGFKDAEKFVLRFIPHDIDINKKAVISDFKTALQEIIQQNPEEKVSYSLVSESGPDHNKTFEVEVLINSNVVAKAHGKSKKQAEQEAAKKVLELMGYETIDN